MRIQELEGIVGSDRATIRFYEKEGLITPNRSENGYRDYTPENAEELKKIRLLRQLGMSIHTIRQLQQGSADLTEALERQAAALSGSILEQQRARAVCCRIRDDGAQYGALDSDHYLNLLKTIRIGENGYQADDFRENVPSERHPWRRWLGRMLDFWLVSGLVSFVIVVALRLRPVPGQFGNALIAIASGALLVPIEAWMLSRWGITPGKLAMGIRAESVNGGQLGFQEALTRSWAVYTRGMCCCIPFVMWLAQLWHYLKLTGRSPYRFPRRQDVPDPEEMAWDADTELVYEKRTKRHGFALAALVGLILLLGIWSGIDGIKPKYRSDALTIAQFAENYNQILDMTQGRGHLEDTLNPDGSICAAAPDLVGLVLNGAIDEGFTKYFEYETENGVLKSVTIKEYFREDRNAMWVKTMRTEQVNLVFTLLLSQPGIRISEIWGIIDPLSSYQAQSSAEIIYGNLLEIEWLISARNCTHDGTMYITEKVGSPSSVYYSFTVRLP